MYQQGLSVSFFAERVAETSHRWYAILSELGTAVKAPRIIFQSLENRYSLPEQSFREYL